MKNNKDKNTKNTKVKENKAMFTEEITNWLTEKNNIVPNETWMNDLWEFNKKLKVKNKGKE